VVAGLDGAVKRLPGELTLSPLPTRLSPSSSRNRRFPSPAPMERRLDCYPSYHVFPGIFVRVSCPMVPRHLQAELSSLCRNDGVFSTTLRLWKLISPTTVSCPQDQHCFGPSDGVAAFQGTIVDFVVGNPNLTSLTTAVAPCGLADTLN
jgi:hypothetical protein